MREKKCGIYCIENIINEKKLIGQSKDMEHRWWSHKSLLIKNKHPNSYLQNAWKKYGEKNFRFKIILECQLEKLDEEEIRLIREYKTIERNFGYNLQTGGHRPLFSESTLKKMSQSGKVKIFTDEHRKNLSIAGINLPQEFKNKSTAFLKKWRDNNSLSLEIKQKLSETKKGNKNPNYRKYPSEETRRKMSIARQGRALLPETIAKIKAIKADKSHTNLGKRWSEETRKKMSASKTGKKHNLYGTHCSEETKQKIRASRIRTNQLNKLKNQSA